MKEILDYLSRLRENNNREWFQAHKEEYDRLRPLFVEKIQELIQQISQFDEDIVGLEAKNCMYRIYRDIRFSPDKTPYKSYMSAYMAKGGRKSLRAGYYFHFEPGNCLLSGGVWCPEPKLPSTMRSWKRPIPPPTTRSRPSCTSRRPNCSRRPRPMSISRTWRTLCSSSLTWTGISSIPCT